MTLSIFYAANCFAWMPLAQYWKSLDRKIHKMYLLRGGKYVRIWTQNPMGDRFYSWANNCEMHLLTEDYEDFADPVDDENFLPEEDDLRYAPPERLEGAEEDVTATYLSTDFRSAIRKSSFWKCHIFSF